MQIDEIVRIRTDCKGVASQLKKCWFQVKDVIYPMHRPYLAVIEVFSHPAFSHKVKVNWKSWITTRYKKNELKGSIYTVDKDILTGD